MRYLSCIGIISLFFVINVFSQDGKIHGKVTDGQSKEPLIGATIIVAESTNGTTTDIDGKYELTLPDGWHLLEINYVGYERVKRRVRVMQGSSSEINIELLMETKDLGLVTISSSKYEKKFGEESVSMEILTPDFIENTNSITLDEALEKVPGVNMLGENVSIRGGSGYSGGAGSRVLMLLDGIPLLTPHSNVIEFESLPLENIKQVEIIKGASSALYGSSALNGIINVITENPKNEANYKLGLFYGIYENPFKGKKKRLYWATRKQTLSGASFLFRKKIKRFDLVLDGAYNRDESHLYNNDQNRVRLNFKTRFRPKNLDNLTVGVNGNFSYQYGGFFFLWQDWGNTPVDSLNDPKYLPNKDSLAYIPNEISSFREIPINIDPYLTYFDKKGNKHYIKGRWYYMKTRTGESENTDASLYYGEYTFHSQVPWFKNVKIDFVTGATASYSYINSDIFGKKKSKNGAAFLQIDLKLLDKLTITAGFRAELFKLDTLSVKIRPIGRFGVNYQFAKSSYLRGSFGQGYRYPSIAERFVKVQRAGQYVVPNEHLKPESSWSAELGIKQGFKISKWFGYLDLSGFVTQYMDMMEFTVAPDSVKREYWPITVPLAFWSDNITDARIYGLEFSAIGQGSIFGIKTNFLIGYTYLVPLDLNYDSELPQYKGRENVLNYRYRHSAKGDLESTVKGVTIGVTGYINSFMENVDQLVELAPGIKSFRDNNHHPEFLLDARVAYTFKKHAKIAFIAKNLFNNQYSNRPAYIESPRNYTVQVGYEF